MVSKTTKDKKKHFNIIYFRRKIANKVVMKKKHGGSVKLILNNLLSTRDYAVFYPVLVYIVKQLFHSLSSNMVDSRLNWR